ncbi:MAG: asparagine synthase (glutamine-hydrolyzing), partial [Pseudomonadota bacterium]|nr:asparagine synthase (glutamine-hydrolyzing) [Pseudomonadota bacterium]
MCGIAGWLAASGSDVDATSLDRMLQLMARRGPDDRGIHLEPGAGLALGHLRLSIIDLSSASHQPMLDADSGVMMVYNGEVYSFRVLRAKLQSLGHRFVSEGDSEVVLRSYLQWGVACFARFAGMFALALWDPRSQCLHLARDAMGMKPLYFVEMGSGLAFASEVKAFKALPDFKLSLSDSGLRQYMEFGYVFDVDQTIFDGVRKLPPGCRAEIRRDGKVRIERYFSPPAPDPNDRRDERERVDELHAVLDEVTQQHLIADVPLGLLLSGGLDSSVIAALAARHASITTISMGFSDSQVDERPYARAVADHIGSQHQEVLITPQQVMQEVESGAWVFDDLFADWGTLTTRLMYRRCGELGIKAVLVGEGADELFGGYDVFRTPARLGLWQQFRLYQRYSGRRHGALFAPFQRIMSAYLEAGQGDAFHAIRLFESCRQLPNQYVMKVDKASMAESIEARAPYLDRRVAELAFRTPQAWLQRGGENKYLLRALARRERLLPDVISQRPKFGAPLAASWMDDHPEFRQFARAR